MMLSRATRTRHKILAGLGVLVLPLSLSGCMARAPQAQVYENEQTLSTQGNAALGLVTDQLSTGFNPHFPGNRTLSTDLISHLTLPSVFLPPATASQGQSVDSDSTTWQLNTSLMESAQVTKESPFQVTYRVQPAAQWGGSPPVPVEARDFDYLWRVMRTAPAVGVDTGYDLIRSIEGRDGGKTVVVTFRRPYAQWRTLFQHLLPSQFLNDIAGLQQLATTVPYSAGPAIVRHADVRRGEITLMPNDKFVSGPRMRSDSLAVQRQSTSNQIAEALRSHQVQAAAVKGDSLTALRVNSLPGVSARYTWRPRQLSLIVNSASSLVGGQPALTKALFSLVRVPLVAQIAADRLASVTSGDVPSVAVPRHILVPPQNDSEISLPDPPAQMETEEARRILEQEGWQRNRDRILTPQGHNRAVVIGVVRDDFEAISAATAIADQLSQEGYPAIVQYASERELYGRWLPLGLVDMTVAWHETDMPLPATVASRFGCPTVDAARPLPTLVSMTSLDPRASSAAGNEGDRQRAQTALSSAKSAGGIDPATGKSVEILTQELEALPQGEKGESADHGRVAPDVLTGARGPNIAGLCDPQIIDLLQRMRQETDSMVSFSSALSAAQPYLSRIEERVWDLGIVLPLWQETLLEVRSSEIINPVPDFLSTPQLGIFYNIHQWLSTGPDDND